MSTTTTTTMSTTTPPSSVADVDTTASSVAVTLVTTVSNHMANLTSNLTDLGSLLGENEDQINRTNASDHTYRSSRRLLC